jgi:hypothetical protein
VRFIQNGAQLLFAQPTDVEEMTRSHG